MKMPKAINVFNRIIAMCLLVAAVIVLVVSSLTTIYYDMHEDVDRPQYGKENIPLLAVLVGISFLFFLILVRSGTVRKVKTLWVISLGLITIYCLTLIFSIKPLPVDDAMLMEEAAREFETGNYSSLTDGGGYLNTWSFQLGYFGYTQILSALFGPGNYLPWLLMQLVCVLGTMYLIYKITWELFGDEEICGIVAVLSLGALFFYNYVTFLYGDIVSLLPQTISIYMMILYLKREKLRYVIASALSIAVSVVLKSNCEIALIALLMILVGSAFSSEDAAYKKHSKKENDAYFSKKLSIRVCLGALMLLAVFGAGKAVDAYYCKITGIEAIPKGSPSWSHIAMGLQESELEDGWYNGYNYRVFAENGYDTAKTSEAAKANIMETLKAFSHNPRRAVKFFLRKFTTQWTDSVCISTHNLDLVSRHVENQPWLCFFLVFGQGSRILTWIMNVFMPVCYLGVLVYLLGIIVKRPASLEEMLLLILIFGGIVFHEFWEGSSRYTMRYYIYYLPYAAYGIRKIFTFFRV